jgi:hypothetical protein
MTATVDRWTARALATLLAMLVVYGCWSTPGLAVRWRVSGAGLGLLAVWFTLAGWVVAGIVRVPTRVEWGVFALVALGLRIGSLLIADGRLSPGDPHWYLVLARNLLAGRGLVLFEPAMAQWVRAEFPPAYPLLLAGWGAVFGLGTAAVLALSTLLDLGTAWLLARIGARVDAPRAGRAAGALYLIWPSVLFSAPLAQKESLELLLIAALAIGWIGAERAGWRAALAIGLPAGLLALTQPGMAPLALLFGLVLIPRIGWRRLLALGIPAAGVAVLVMLPWWVRNRRVLGAFVPLTSVGGLSLWIGENPEATGNWMPYPPELAGLPELAFARAAGRMAIDWMVHHPLEVARLNATKLARSLGVGQFGLVRLAAMRPAPGVGWTAALLPVAQAAHLLLLGGSAWALTRRPPPIAVALLLAGVLQVALFGVWFEFGERHRELLVPFLLLVFAAAIRPRTVPSASASPSALSAA